MLVKINTYHISVCIFVQKLVTTVPTLDGFCHHNHYHKIMAKLVMASYNTDIKLIYIFLELLTTFSYWGVCYVMQGTVLI